MESQKNILLIEDEQSDQFFFRLALKGIANASLYHIASNGLEALTKLTEPGILPDLIFTDINMPVMDGIQCLSEIKKNPSIKNIPVIVLSSDTTAIDVVQKMGAKAFIQKTGDYKMLQMKLEEAINMDFSGNIFITN
jgi:CheY-like chemotaxis protein